MGAPFRSINQAPLSNEPGAPASSLFLYQTEAGMAEKNFLETAPPYLRVRMTAPPPPLSEGLDPPLPLTQILHTTHQEQQHYSKSIHLLYFCTVKYLYKG